MYEKCISKGGYTLCSPLSSFSRSALPNSFTSCSHLRLMRLRHGLQDLWDAHLQREQTASSQTMQNFRLEWFFKHGLRTFQMPCNVPSRPKDGTCRNRTRHNCWTICPDYYRLLLRLTSGTLALRNQRLVEVFRRYGDSVIVVEVESRSH